MIDDVDLDGSGEIEFDEFIAVMSKQAEHKENKDKILQAFEFLGHGGGTDALRYGEVRGEKLRHWLELYKPAEAKMSVEECMTILYRAEKMKKEEVRDVHGKTERIISFEDFVDLSF